MVRALVGIALALLTLAALAGCGSAPSVPIAPDVKEPDNRNVSGAEILRRKQASEAGSAPGASSNIAPQ